MADAREQGDEWGEPTRWSLIERAAGQRPDADAQLAWRDLLGRYRPAVEQSLRRALRNDPHWKDAAADFFAYLYEQEILPRVDRDQGRFRCYMQGVLRRYALHWLRTDGRSGALDVDELELGASETEAEFERQEESAWAQDVFRNAVERLRSAHPREAEFLLRAYGIPPWKACSREELCAEFGLNLNQLNVAVHRARGWLGEELLSEIRQLVCSQRAFDVEQDLLLARLSSAHPGLFAPGSSAPSA